MRLLFMGTPSFAAVSLKALINAGFEFCGVVTQPDRPQGRGLQLQPSAVKLVALEANLVLFQPTQVGTPDFLNEFKNLTPDLVVVVAFGQKIPAEILFGTRYGCINVHGSLLPKYRGAAPIQWSILNGDSTTGVSTMYMDEGWDTGDLIYQSEIKIDLEENFASLYQRLAELGGDLLVKTVKSIAAGVAPRIPQTNARTSKAPKIRAEQAIIVWEESAFKINNLVRALAPLPAAETNLVQERLKIIETRVILTADQTSPGQPGEILQLLKGEGILVATGDRPLLITKLQPSGKKIMSAHDYANGRRLNPGMFFGKTAKL